MKILFLAVDDAVNIDKHNKINAVLVDEKKQIIKTVNETLESSAGKIQTLLELKPDKIIVYSDIEKRILTDFLHSDLFKNINNALCLKNLILDDVKELHGVSNISFKDLLIGYDIDDKSESISELVELYFAYKAREVFNIEPLKGDLKVNSNREKELSITRVAKKSIFVDFEFDIENRQKAELISIGAVVTDDGVNSCDSFYSVINTVNKKELSQLCMDITHITQNEVDNADNLKVVMNKFYTWVNKFGRNSILYNWGNFDKVALSKILRNNGLGIIYNRIFKDMYDIQVEISNNIRINNEIICKCIGLEKMKDMYGIKGEIKHNALEDACDLMKVVNAYKKYNYNPLIVRKMYKENLRKTFLWNYNFINKKYNISYDISCFIKSLKADIDIEKIKKKFNIVYFKLIKDIPIQLVITFENGNLIKEFNIKLDAEQRELLKTFVKLDLPEIIANQISI